MAEERRAIQPYKHDCDRCIWCGWVPMGDGQLANLYYCPPREEAAGDRGSILLRFSDRPGDYFSTPVGAAVKGSVSVDEEFYEKWQNDQIHR